MSGFCATRRNDRDRDGADEKEQRMSEDDFQEHDCDLCGSSDAIEIEVARHYTDGQPLHVCKGCGFVYVRRRRSAKRIAEVWSDDIYGEGYTARIPAVKARQVYVAEFLDTSIGLKSKAVCDIGGGEGQFLELIGTQEYGAKAFAIEPSPKNCKMMSAAGIENFCGSIEDYRASPKFKDRRFDVITIMWTLENCQSCRTMVDAAYDILKNRGHLLIATGSRILVPFKKPMQYYLNTNPADTHCFRFSANTLGGVFAVSGFKQTHINRYIDTDYLMAIAQRTDRSKDIPWEKDDYRQVIDFFKRWHQETQKHYKDD